MLLLLLTQSLAQAGEYMDVWITTAFEDTNVLAGPDSYSPSINFVERGNSAFFENYESRTTDDISRANLVLYRKDEGFFTGWTTEAAFVLRYSPYLDPDQSDPGTNLEDDGSYVRLVRSLGGEDQSLSLTGYAVDSNRFRLGYSYDLSWGGRQIYAFTTGAAPGARLQWQSGGHYAFLGAKSAIGDYKDPVTQLTRNQAYYGMLAGGGLQFGQNVKVEAGAGTFQQGQILNVPDTTSVLYGENINALGIAGQVAFRSTDEISFITSQELRLYRNAPDFVKDTYIRHDQVDGAGVLIQGEWNYLAHNLLDPNTNNSTIIESGMAGDLQTVLVAGTTAIGVDLVYKDLQYIVFNVPGLTSGVALNPSMPTTPQLYGRLKASHFFENAHLQPTAGIGVMQPATYETGSGTFVQYSERDKEQVPEGQSATPIISGIGGLQVDMSKSMVVVGEVLYTLDNNLSDFVQDEEGLGGKRVAAPSEERNQLGVNVFVRARF